MWEVLGLKFLTLAHINDTFPLAGPCWVMVPYLEEFQENNVLKLLLNQLQCKMFPQADNKRDFDVVQTEERMIEMAFYEKNKSR